jgi:predicted ester cyclase
MMFSSFPDMNVTMEGIFGENDSVGTYGYWTASHNGEFMGKAATGKRVKVNFVDIWKIKDGKLHENWVQMDFAGLMKQLQ